ncbi:MAG: rhodanese-like domain-containing protein [Crocinitomicaceae bacterium]
MGLFGNLLGNKSEKVKELLANGAVVIDVRSAGEFSGGHVAGSKNFPLPLDASAEKKILALKKPVVFCCASGMRSGQATAQMKNKGLECENGGGWMKVNGLV